MRHCLLILTCVLLIHSGFSQPQYRFQHFDTKDGLASDLSTRIIQDSLGFLWIDYNSGRTRYDGYNFKVYNRDPEDPSKSPTIPESKAVVLDHAGNLWLIPMNPAKHFELAKYDRITDSFVLYKANLEDPRGVFKVAFEKNDGSVWMATSKGISSFKIQKDTISEVQNYSIPHRDSLSRAKNNFVFDILVRDSGVVLATRAGVWEFDKIKKTFHRPLCDPNDSAWLYRTTFYNIFQDNDQTWLVDDGAFSRVDTTFSLVQRLALPGGRSGVGVMGFDRDKKGVFWIATWMQGLCRYDPADSSIVFIKNVLGDPYSLRSDKTGDVLVDRDQNIWVTTFRGISRLRRQDVIFYNTELPGVGRSGVSTVFKSGDSDYVVINKSDGEHRVMIAPIIPGRLDSLNFRQAIPTFRGAQVNGFWKGKQNFWITVWGVGVVSVPVNQKTGMIENGPLRTLGHDPDNTNTISSPFTTTPWEDSQGNLWVGAINGLNKVIPNLPYGIEGSVTRYHHIHGDTNSLIDDHALGFYPEGQNSFWITTLGGVDLFSNNQFQHVFLKNRQPRNIHKSSDGILTIGTGGGLYEGTKNGDKYIFKKLTLLETADVVGISEDNLGRLWISTKQGIACYDRNEQVAINFDENDGFIHKRMPHSGFRQNLTSRGIMVISDFDGVSLFDPSTLRINRNKTRPLLVKLAINNEPTAISSASLAENQFIVNEDITVLDELILDHQHNNFTLEFSAMELTSPEKNLYRHKLEGYDEEWIETDAKSRTATYTNLDPGHYVFRVKASNYHGVWNDNEATLSVIILPPPWKTWWAYSIYSLLLLTAILYWRSYEIKRLKLKQRAAYLSEIDQVKTRFFTNISHEFRTPLTLILGPLKEMHQEKFNGDTKSAVATMLRNGQRLLRLINQLLDLSKIEAGKMELHPSRVDMVELLRQAAASYESLAREKQIKFFFYSEEHELIANVDSEKIEKVVHNLLSNAFKFTTTDGEVILSVKVVNKDCAIAVKDTGIGIAPAQLDKVFDRFYQVDSSQTRSYEGSGLGMALARELVELHKGTISVQSTEGKGTTFTVSVPLGNERLHKNEIRNLAYDSEAEMISMAQYAGENGGSEPVRALASDQPVVLIVEDNADMRNYIRKTLSGLYEILEAEDGQAGVKMAQETVPDLIISDIMMPQMDGYRLCKSIKSKELTSHIPVILLTAKADHRSKLAGLETGADDYLSKPFDAEELKLIVRNRIEDRQRMRERFSREVTLEPQHIAITSLDEKFLSKVMFLIEEHMADENFSIEALCTEVGYSHMQFIRKIKALSGQTPSHFLRTIRLKRAAELISARADNISQIAFMVGFNSLSYFNKCFKEQFGVTPGKFINETKAVK